MTVLYLAIALISTYVLWFSTIPWLYRLVIVALSLVMLVLMSLALAAMESIGRRPI
jgi:hypothetical protein